MKKKLVNEAFLFLLALCCFSCASTNKISRESSENAKNIQPPEGKSLVYVYRTSALGFAVGLQVDLNGNNLSYFYPKKFYLCTLEPGKYIFTGKGENEDDLILTTEPNKKYYIKVKPKMGFASARVELELNHPVKGNSDIQNCRMIGSTDNISPFAVQTVLQKKDIEEVREIEQKPPQPNNNQLHPSTHEVSISTLPIYSLIAGFNLASLKTENNSDYDKLKPGFHVGGAVAFPLSEFLAIEPGLRFSMKGESYEYSGYNTSNNLNYLEIPLNGVYKVDLGGNVVLLNAGPYLGISLGSKRKTSNDGNSTKVKIDTETLDYGLNAGASFLMEPYTFGLQYGLGLADVFNVTSNNRVISLSLGYRLGNKTDILNLKNSFSGNKQIPNHSAKQTEDYDSPSSTIKYENKYQKKISVGAGIGVAYGVIGINGEYALHDYASISAGFGTSVFAGMAGAIGGRAYAKPLGSKWRPRLSAHYGTNSIINVTGSVEIQEKYEGLTVGVGFLQMFGSDLKTGFDFEIVYLATQGDFQKRVETIENRYDVSLNTGRIKILIGYRIAF